MSVKGVLINQYRWGAALARNMVDVLTSDLTEDELNWQARAGHHSIWHNLWHMYLSEDYYAAAALNAPAIWDEDNWRDRMDLTSMARAFDYPDKGVGMGHEKCCAALRHLQRP